jgi:hypothetical protein
MKNNAITLYRPIRSVQKTPHSSSFIKTVEN